MTFIFNATFQGKFNDFIRIIYKTVGKNLALKFEPSVNRVPGNLLKPVKFHYEWQPFKNNPYNLIAANQHCVSSYWIKANNQCLN